MQHPWGLSGPEFLVLYGMALAGLGCVFALVRSVFLLRGGEQQASEDQLGLYERAYLHGGTERVADTALAGLVESGAVRVDRQRRLHATDEETTDEYQRTVLAEIGIRNTVPALRKAFRRSGRCATLMRRLRQRDLIVSARGRNILLALLWMFPLLGLVNVVRAINGIRLGFPVGGLAVELVVTFIAWTVAAGHCEHPLTTSAGAAVKAEGKKPIPVLPYRSGQHRRGRVRDRQPTIAESVRLFNWDNADQDAASRVARRGIGAYPDVSIARLLEPPRSSGGGGAAGGVASGGGGGGGCGGGGC